jgi:hypothetical protein
LQDPEHHRQMGRAARASVKENWQKEPSVRRYEDYYRQVLRA